MHLANPKTTVLNWETGSSTLGIRDINKSTLLLFVYYAAADMTRKKNEITVTK